jgi:RNA polymerase sigma-70 factor (ECF subfamily)
MTRLATGDADEALDIVQDSMLYLAKKYPQHNEAEWRPLFYRILQNKIKDWYRKKKTISRWRVWLGMGNNNDDERDPLDTIADPKGITPENATEAGTLRAMIYNALAGLPLRQQQAFLLRAWEEFDTRETAVIMNCSEGSVKTHYSRAISHLKKSLEGLWP